MVVERKEVQGLMANTHPRRRQVTGRANEVLRTALLENNVSLHYFPLLLSSKSTRRQYKDPSGVRSGAAHENAANRESPPNPIGIELATPSKKVDESV